MRVLHCERARHGQNSAAAAGDDDADAADDDDDDDALACSSGYGKCCNICNLPCWISFGFSRREARGIFAQRSAAGLGGQRLHSTLRQRAQLAWA